MCLCLWQTSRRTDAVGEVGDVLHGERITVRAAKSLELRQRHGVLTQLKYRGHRVDRTYRGVDEAVDRVSEARATLAEVDARRIERDEIEARLRDR